MAIATLDVRRGDGAVPRATGRSGPATWELGSYPEGQADFPVGGISWFEAAAYAEFAGKSLPTRLSLVSRVGRRRDLLATSCGSATSTARARCRRASAQGLGPWGTLDMAGNVKEWCANAGDGDRSRRYILGGGWNEPSYRFTEPDAQNPWERATDVRRAACEEPRARRRRRGVPVGRVNRDPKSVVPVSDELFDVYRRFYAYDRTPLECARRVRSTTARRTGARRRSASPRHTARARFPRTCSCRRTRSRHTRRSCSFPSAYARDVAVEPTTSTCATFDFIVRSGRALMYPVYQGTFERRRTRCRSGPSAARDMRCAVGEGFLPRGRLPRDPPDIDMQAARRITA